MTNCKHQVCSELTHFRVGDMAMFRGMPRLFNFVRGVKPKMYVLDVEIPYLRCSSHCKSCPFNDSIIVQCDSPASMIQGILKAQPKSGIQSSCGSALSCGRHNELTVSISGAAKSRDADGLFLFRSTFSGVTSKEGHRETQSLFQGTRAIPMEQPQGRPSYAWSTRRSWSHCKLARIFPNSWSPGAHP